MLKKLIIRLYFMLFLLFIFPFFVKAECNYQRKSDLSKIASNVQLSYTYDVDQENKPVFVVTISNLTNDIYIVDNIGNVYSGEGEISYGGYSGLDGKYTIYSNDNNCKGEQILKKYLKIPYYNFYYNSEECKENPDFKYCKLWDYVTINSSDFDNELLKYKTDKENSNIDNNKSQGDFSFNIYTYLSGFGVLLLIIIIFVAIKRLKNI